MKRRIYIALIIILILVLAVGGCRRAGTWLVKHRMPEHADVMVMLTGRISDRVLQVDDLYQQQVAGRVWIVQENMGAETELLKRGVQLLRESDLSRNALIQLGIPPDSILILPGDASSTQMEAESVRDFIGKQNTVDTLLVVTSSSHSRRAIKIFKAAFGSLENPPALYVSPSRYTEFQAEQWWKSKDDIQTVVFEYLKMTNFFLFEKRKLRSGEN